MDLHPIRPVKLGVKSIEIMSTKFDQAGVQCNLSEFPPNLTSRIGCKSIEITLPVKGIRLGINYW